MKLKYIVQPTNSGGAAVPGCGTIHLSEIDCTLSKLSKDLGLNFNLNAYKIASTGKREYSGDIDVVIDTKLFYGTEELIRTTLRKELIELYGNDCVAKNGSMLHVRIQIQKYNELYQDLQPRNGYVQVDFNFGNADWERFFHYSAGEESEYKGAHRNITLSAISSLTDVKVSNLVDFYDRPISSIRWRFGPKGFIKMDRHSVMNHLTHDWNNKQEDAIIAGPFYDPKYISKILFPIDGAESDLNSLETIMTAVKRNFGMVDQERIWKRIAYGIKDWKYGKDFIYPEEIHKYFIELF